jgi:hypothetical protein
MPEPNPKATLNPPTNQTITWSTPLTNVDIPPRAHHDPRLQDARQNERPAPDVKDEYPRFRKWLMSRAHFCLADVRAMFAAWDWMLKPREQAAATLDRIENLLNLSGVVPWEDEAGRADCLGGKMKALLVELMRRHGYMPFKVYYDFKQRRVREYYVPAEGRKPNMENLPEWLPWCYVNLEKPPVGWIRDLYPRPFRGSRERSGLGWKEDEDDIADIHGPYWLTQ